MAYDTKLADTVREYFNNFSNLAITEKKMFGGLAFLVNNKMCVNVSGNNLMCRYDPALLPIIEGRKGYQNIIMRGRQLEGFCYVTPDGFATKKDFAYWLDICLDYNQNAKPSRKAKKK
ncbi:TfoX/Sxy family protein [Flavisolibacter tropicus]|uniref:RNA methyltransferase n=1 Tax=Flavisolibacter tropicus TaxID=1492898 RepID=A0A172U160_9BACT|nr:TfoX/Sxy family protein [Flavisolibacter tropicus]ANE52763.1 RNA methyltransferase [Flavisolibacter tropicus]